MVKEEKWEATGDEAMNREAETLTSYTSTTDSTTETSEFCVRKNPDKSEH